MKRGISILAICILGLVILGQTFAQTNTVTPAFDVTGVWSPGGEATSQCFQEGTTVQCIYNTPDFAHYAIGRYVNSNQIRLKQTRRSRATGCTTTMEVILRFTSANTITVGSTALDSNCDLTPGPLPAGVITRVL